RWPICSASIRTGCTAMRRAKESPFCLRSKLESIAGFTHRILNGSSTFVLRLLATSLPGKTDRGGLRDDIYVPTSPSTVKGVRVPRTKGGGEGTLQKRRLGGREVWWARWVEYGPDGKKRRPEKIVGTTKEFPSKMAARDELNRLIRESSGR